MNADIDESVGKKKKKKKKKTLNMFWLSVSHYSLAHSKIIYSLNSVL
jgi:hypothetical protein